MAFRRPSSSDLPQDRGDEGVPTSPGSPGHPGGPGGLPSGGGGGHIPKNDPFNSSLDHNNPHLPGNGHFPGDNHANIGNDTW